MRILAFLCLAAFAEDLDAILWTRSYYSQSIGYTRWIAEANVKRDVDQTLRNYQWRCQGDGGQLYHPTHFPSCFPTYPDQWRCTLSGVASCRQ